MSFGRLPFFVSTVALSAIMAGCSPTTMTAISPGASMDLMTGAGSVSRSPDGETSFRYVIPTRSYASYSPEEAQAQHEWLISSWVGSQGICPDGYTVSDPAEESSGMLVYTGTCK